MGGRDNLDTLKNVAIFRGLNAEIFEKLVAESSFVLKQTGEYFFRENDPARSMYVIRSGRVEITRNWQKRTYHIRQMGRSDCFGEMGIIDHGTRSANVRAISRCEAIEISAATIESIMQDDFMQYALLQRNIALELSRHLREANNRLFVASVESEKRDIYFDTF